MSHPALAADYRSFRLNRLKEPEYRHLLYFLFWPALGLRYLIVENVNPASEYHLIYAPLDDWIPFREEAVVFYVFWFVFIIGMHVYTALYDIPAFRQYSRFLILSMSISTCIFLIYPSYQNLRPETFPRDNLFTRMVGVLYWADTSTNVFPSEHAIGSMAVLAAALHTDSLRTPRRIGVIAVLAVLISLSTLFLKQHSVLDVLAALPICAFAYWFTYRKRDPK